MTLAEIGIDRLGKDSNILEVEVKSYTECGYCSDSANTVEIEVPWRIYSEWLYLSNQVGEKEWAGVFTVKNGVVADFKIPKQEVSAVSVEFKEELGGNGIVHSHHGMGAFHSAQDDKHCRNLYEYSIVVSSNGYTASKHEKVPCGALAYMNVSLAISGIPPNIDLSKITEMDRGRHAEHPRQEQQTCLVPDEPTVSIENLPCDRCTTYDCNNRDFTADGYEARMSRF